MSLTVPMSKASHAKDNPQAHTFEMFETAVRAMQERKFDKAKGLFDKVVSSAVPALADRARIYLNACNQHLVKQPELSFQTVEEHFDYSISLMNSGDYLSAREHLSFREACVVRRRYR